MPPFVDDVKETQHTYEHCSSANLYSSLMYAVIIWLASIPTQ